MHGGWLNNGTARGNEPVKALRLRHVSQLTGPLTALADMDNIIELLLNGCRVKIGSQGTQTFLVQVHAHAKKTQRATKQDNANVEAFAALYTGNNPDERIIIGTGRAHAGSPP